MKIAFINQPIDGFIPPHHNSIGLWTHHVAPYLAEKNDVSAYFRWKPTQRSWNQEDNLRTHFVHSLPKRIVENLDRVIAPVKNKDIPIFASQLYYLDYILPIALSLRRQQVDLVHIHNFTQFVPIVRMINPRIKIVLHMHGEWLSQLDAETMKKRAEMCDLILGSSDHITNLIRTRFPQLADRCHTVHNGVNVENFSMRSDNGCRADSKKRLLFVGRVSPEKGVHVLLEAFPSIAEKHPDIELDIIGHVGAMPMEYLVGLSDEPEVNSLAAYYHEPYGDTLNRLIPPQLASQVHFTGNLPQESLIDYYQNADVLINPSYSESFGMSLVEALASGCPVVASRVGGMVEIVNGDNVGILVNRGDVTELKNAVVELLDDNESRIAMGRAGHNMVADRFSWPQIAQRTMDLYERV